MRTHNYKSEQFHDMDSLDTLLHGIVKQIKQNFKDGISLPVSTFNRGKSREKLAEFIGSIHENHNTHLSKKTDSKDFPGLYIFAERKDDKLETAYVGISRMVIQRLKQHTSYSDKSSATWAYLMAKFPNGEKVPVTDKKDAVQFKDKDALTAKIKEQQVEMAKKYVVTYYPMDDNFLLHLAEPYVACALSAYWNSFETH
ncbi:hypothetical protein OAE48_02255 [Flavobacteriales bacterium]|nr:hypothetical protein [Flavobacteriales bacterium]